MAKGDLSIEHLRCCGGRELHGISHYYNMRGVVDEAWADCYHAPEAIKVYDYDKGAYVDGMSKASFLCPSFYLFTQASNDDDDDLNGYGDRLKEFIEKSNLGTVIVSPANRNDNSGNMVEAFIWTVDRDNFKAWDKVAQTKQEIKNGIS